MWMYDGNKRKDLIEKNVRMLMHDILKPLAKFLFKQPSLPSEPDLKACAPFNLYQFDRSLNADSPKKQVVSLVEQAAEKHPELKPLVVDTKSLIDICDLDLDL
jgi:hypothetical protein